MGYMVRNADASQLSAKIAMFRFEKCRIKRQKREFGLNFVQSWDKGEVYFETEQVSYVS